MIEHEERELIESIIEFGDTVAREVMVPRPDMVTRARATAGSPTSLEVAIAHGYSRLPVVRRAASTTSIGIAYAKDLMRAERDGRGRRPGRASIVRPAHFVPETKPVAELHARDAGRQVPHGDRRRRVRRHRRRWSRSRTASRSWSARSSTSTTSRTREVERLADGDFRVNGSMPIDELNDLLERELPDDDWDTVGGFVFGMLGHVPERGRVASSDRQWTLHRRGRSRAAASARCASPRIPTGEPVDDVEER